MCETQNLGNLLADARYSEACDRTTARTEQVGTAAGADVGARPRRVSAAAGREKWKDQPWGSTKANQDEVPVPRVQISAGKEDKEESKRSKFVERHAEKGWAQTAKRPPSNADAAARAVAPAAVMG